MHLSLLSASIASMLSLAACATTSFAGAPLAPAVPLPRVAAAPRMVQSQKLESPIPGVARPEYLDGTLAGDAGLDPLRLVERYSEGVKVTVPAMNTVKREPTDAGFTSLKSVTEYNLYGKEIVLGPNTKDTQRSLMWYREAEIKHARLAMLAAAGWPLAELWHGPICKITGSEYILDVTQGRSLSVLNGGLGEVGGFLFLALLATAVVECATLDNVYGLTATGKTMKPDGSVVVKSYVPGDCGFDPLNLCAPFRDAALKCTSPSSMACAY